MYFSVLQETRLQELKTNWLVWEKDVWLTSAPYKTSTLLCTVLLSALQLPLLSPWQALLPSRCLYACGVAFPEEINGVLRCIPSEISHHHCPNVPLSLIPEHWFRDKAPTCSFSLNQSTAISIPICRLSYFYLKDTGKQILMSGPIPTWSFCTISSSSSLFIDRAWTV